MSKFDDFDLDLQNIKVSNNISPNSTTFIVCNSLTNCTSCFASNECTESPSCNNTMCTCPSGNCPGSVDHCQQNV